MENPAYTAFLGRSKVRWGDRFDPSKLDPRFIPYFETGQRIKVSPSAFGEPGTTSCGTVSATTGWQPVFILMRSRRSVGSSHVLGKRDTIVAVKTKLGYVNDPSPRNGL